MTTVRQRQILEWLEREGAGSYPELAERLGVSAMTVRREVDRLAALGRVIKTLGGVQRADAPSYLMETAIHARMGRNRVEKQAMARAAIALAEGAETLFLDGSTTCLELAKLIARRLRGVTVVTNSALTALELGHSRNNTVVGVGGELDPNSCCFVGSVAEEAAERYFVDVAFVSTMGFLPAEGTFEFDGRQLPRQADPGAARAPRRPARRPFQVRPARARPRARHRRDRRRRDR